jgi:hypothetical protein
MQHHVQQATEATMACHYLEVPHKEHGYVIMPDYAHNVPLPHSVGEQLGKIYYFLPLKINMLGIVVLTLTPKKLKCNACPGVQCEERWQQFCLYLQERSLK